MRAAKCERPAWTWTMTDIRIMRLQSAVKNTESALTSSLFQLENTVDYAQDLDADVESDLEIEIGVLVRVLRSAQDDVASVLRELASAEKVLGD